MLKRSFSLPLILLVFLNTIGYYLVFLGIEYKNDIHMIQKLDASEYNQLTSITVKIPIAIPYLSDDTEYTRVDGKYEYHGEYYRMVKQKYGQDTLYIVCVKDQENKRIHSAMSDYVKSFAGKSTTHDNLKNAFSFNKDYIQHHLKLSISTFGWVLEFERKSFYNNLIPTYSPSIIHPPERG